LLPKLKIAVIVIIAIIALWIAFIGLYYTGILPLRITGLESRGAIVFNGISIDVYGNDKYSLTIAEKMNKTFFKYHDTNKEVEKDVKITPDRWHNVKLDFKEDNVEISFDNKLLAKLMFVDLSNGQFVLETKNTYAHFRGVNIQNKQGEQKKYNIEQDPCQIKSIGEQIISQRQLSLDADEKTTIDETFRINKLFDYAKISTIVENQEIHFWVSRG